MLHINVVGILMKNSNNNKDNGNNEEELSISDDSDSFIEYNDNLEDFEKEN